jgi:hypothetical protein
MHTAKTLYVQEIACIEQKRLANMRTGFLEKIIQATATHAQLPNTTSNSCFDFFAALWVFSMEKVVPSMQKELHQTEIMDNLQQTQVKLNLRKQELHARLKDILEQATKAQLRKDIVVMRNRIVSAKRIKAQIQKMETASMILEDNMDTIVNNDMHKDIIASLQQATSTLKAQIMEIGGVDTVSEMMIDLDDEMQKQKDITDTLCKTPHYMNNMSNGATADESVLHNLHESDEELQRELQIMLAEDNEDSEFRALGAVGLSGAASISFSHAALKQRKHANAENSSFLSKTQMIQQQPQQQQQSLLLAHAGSSFENLEPETC